MDGVGLGTVRLLTLTGHAPVRVDDPQIVWIVESGSLLVFAVMLVEGEPHGARRYLFTATAGDPLFCIPTSVGADERVILAVPLGDPIVRECRISGGALSPELLVQRWAALMTSAFPEGFRGAVAPPRFPAADSSVSIEDSLAAFHAECLSALGELDRMEAAAEFDRLHQKRQLEVVTTRRALEGLAKTISGQKALPEAVAGDPLFMAAHAVGAGIGVPLVPATAEQGHPARTTASPKAERAELESIARASGVRIRRVTLTTGWWKHDAGPLIAFTRKAVSPVALLPSNGRYELFDPVAHTRSRIDASSAAEIAPPAYMLYKPLPEGLTRPLEMLKFAFSGHSRDLWIVGLTAMGVTLLGAVTPLATAIIIDSAVPDGNRSLVFQLGLALAAAVFGRAIFGVAQGVALLHLESHSAVKVQAGLWDRLLRLSPRFFRSYTTGDLHTRAAAVSEARDKLTGVTMQSAFLALTGTFNVLLMFYYSPVLAVVGVLAAAVLVAVTFACGTIAYREINALHALSGRIIGLTVQLINGVTKLRVAAAERLAFATWATEYRNQQTLTLRIQRLTDTITALNQVLPTFATIVLFWFGAQIFTGASANIGLFLAFIAAFSMFLSGASALSMSAIDLLNVSNIWTRAKPIFDAPLEVDATKTQPGRLEGGITLERVSFRYRAEGVAVLDRVSLRVEPGSFVALVGPTGSGKSTVLRLMLGFERPDAGGVYYDGKDLSGLDVHAVRRQLGVVLQNSNVMSASILENIAAGGILSLDDAWAAARRAALDADIEAMPMGMYTFICEGGTNLSVGQRQRLLIARALAANPGVILFDEATSALDNATQAIVQRSLEELRITRVVVAHRLSTVRRADRIYVLESGRIVQQGTFTELARQEGLFRRLMAKQML